MNDNWEQSFQLQPPKHDTVEKKNFMAVISDGKGDDIIFQFFKVKIQDFDGLLAEVIEDHFGSTNSFALEYVQELDMYGLLAKDIKSNALFNKKFHIDSFLDILDSTISELKK